MRRFRGLVIAFVAIVAVGACGPFCLSGKVTLSNAHIDSSYKCPNPANDTSYVIHGSVDVDNSTTKDISIKAMSEAGILVDVHGAWSIGSVGQKYDEAIDTFSPTSVKSGNKTTIKFNFNLHCTSDGPPESTYGDFELKITLVSSAGTFTTSTLKHRLVIT